MAAKEQEDILKGKQLKIPEDLKANEAKVQAEYEILRSKAQAIFGDALPNVENALAVNDEAALIESLESVANLELSEENKQVLANLAEYHRRRYEVERSIVQIARDNMSR
jgi:hypothetical protein